MLSRRGQASTEYMVVLAVVVVVGLVVVGVLSGFIQTGETSTDMVCSGTECWYTDVFLLGDRTGKLEFKLLYTANDIPSWCATCGLNAFSWAKLKG